MKNKYEKNERIYKSKPLGYRQWGQVKKEMYQLVYVIAGLALLNTIVYFGASAIFQFFKG